MRAVLLIVAVGVEYPALLSTVDCVGVVGFILRLKDQVFSLILYNVAWFCKKTGATLVFPFSMAVLGDPQSFPITADQPRDPLNWYGRTKLLGERTVESFANGAFPVHLFLKSNLYGEHIIDRTEVGEANRDQLLCEPCARG
jgi:hypothetical protein